MPNPINKIIVWQRVYRRIRFFRKMYPFSSLVKDAFLLPVDYFFGSRSIRTLRNLTVAVTHRCNLRCEMCYFHKELGDGRDLPLELYKRIIDSVKKTRPCVILSGGEPFMHPQLLEMVDYAKACALPVQVFTNGTLLKPAIADSLIWMGLDYIDFSLLGDRDSHSLIAGMPEAYDKLISNMEYFAAHRAGTRVVLNFTITPRGALKGINHAVELARRYNLDGLRIQHYNFLLPKEFEAQTEIMQGLFGIAPAAHGIEDYMDTPALAEEIIGFKKKISGGLERIPVQWAPTLTDNEIKKWYSAGKFDIQRKCLFPWRGMLVDADGKVYPCSKIYLELGDTETQGVFEAWNSKRMKDFRSRLKKSLFPACSRCCKL